MATFNTCKGLGPFNTQIVGDQLVFTEDPHGMDMVVDNAASWFETVTTLDGSSTSVN